MHHVIVETKYSLVRCLKASSFTARNDCSGSDYFEERGCMMFYGEPISSSGGESLRECLIRRLSSE